VSRTTQKYQRVVYASPFRIQARLASWALGHTTSVNGFHGLVTKLDQTRKLKKIAVDPNRHDRLTVSADANDNVEMALAIDC
jgi:hypothetical protein